MENHRRSLRRYLWKGACVTNTELRMDLDGNAQLWEWRRAWWLLTDMSVMAKIDGERPAVALKIFMQGRTRTVTLCSVIKAGLLILWWLRLIIIPLPGKAKAIMQRRQEEVIMYVCQECLNARLTWAFIPEYADKTWSVRRTRWPVIWAVSIISMTDVRFLHLTLGKALLILRNKAWSHYMKAYVI